MPELHYWIDKDAHNGYDGKDDVVIVSTEHGVRVFVLSNDDGYRSHCDEDTQFDNVTLWAKCEVDLANRKTISYDKIEFDIEEDSDQKDEEEQIGGASKYGKTEIDIRAWKNGRIVFEIGTTNVDDYYPNYFLYVGTKEIR